MIMLHVVKLWCQIECWLKRRIVDLSLLFEKGTGHTLQGQIFEQVRRLILNGHLKPGMPLPPTRQLSERMRVARNTVSLAYERLAAEGFIEARGRSGTYVRGELPSDLLHLGGQQTSNNLARTTNRVGQELPSPLLCFAGYPPGVGRLHGRRPAIDFWVGRSDPSTFPISTWRRILLRKLATSAGNLTEYGDPSGLRELRIAIANLLGRSRGMLVTEDQVIVTGGSQDGLNLICRLVNQDDHPFFIENPCYQGAAYLFQSIGAQLWPIPVDENGLIVEKLPRDCGGVLFVTPSHQYPTGAVLSLERRISLLRWAKETNSVIVEDDYDSDFRYDGRPLTSLAGLDDGDRVLYLGTFSKSLGAGLRLGFAVVPKEQAASARIVKSQMNQGQPWLDQAVLAEFLESGFYDRHLRRTRKVYKRRLDCLKACLEKHFGDADLSGADGGLHVVWRLPPGSPPANVIERRARARNVGVYALNSGGAHDFDLSSRNDVLVLGYSSLKEEDIEHGISLLSGIVKGNQNGEVPVSVSDPVLIEH